MALLDGFLIVNNEEELIRYALESFVSLGDLLGIVSLVDNNSTDATLEIVESFRGRLNLVIQHEWRHSNHGRLRNMALEPCTADWIFYLDADESFTSDFADWLRSGALDHGPAWQIFKYTTIFDRYHFVEGGNGPTQRLFRHFPGSGFPQDIHTVPSHQSLSIWMDVPGVLMFDHTAVKSWEALWAKGFRYQWAYRQKEPAVGGPAEYIVRVENALNVYPERNKEFPADIRSRIFCGPDFVPGHPGKPYTPIGIV